MMRKLAPIILFVYNRPLHTEKVLEALMLNELADQSTLYVYSDGPKNEASEKDLKNIKEVRTLIRKKKWCKEVFIVESIVNIGLAKNISTGVTEVVTKHGNIIVLEDDIVTSKGFLKYMNDALEYYENEEKVIHISGFMYPHDKKLPETFFYNVPLCWGWATWERSWKYFESDSVKLWNLIQSKKNINGFDKFGSDYLSSQLAHNITGNLNTWFIKWHASVYLKNGYTLYPSVSLVDNIGFDNSGVHNGATELFTNDVLAENISIKEIDLVENIEATGIISSFYNQFIFSPTFKNPENISFKKKLKRKIKNTFYRIFPEVKKLVPGMENKTDLVLYKSYLGKFCKIYPKARLANSIVGRYTYIAENSIINNTTIGKFCSIGPNLISGWGVHPVNGISTNPMFYSTRQQNGITLSENDKVEEILPVRIGNDVFIGMNVTILDGVTIGDGAVIGAGAVVSKDIPPYAIAVGSPIKIKNHRFNEDIIARLLKIKWWDFDESELSIIENHFFDIEKFLKIIEERNSLP